MMLTSRALAVTGGGLAVLGNALLPVDVQRLGREKLRSRAMDLLRQLKGGGGTDFQPVFDACAAMRPPPDLLIYATDGDGGVSKAPPKGMRTIWLLTRGHAPPCDWGDRIFLND